MTDMFKLKANYFEFSSFASTFLRCVAKHNLNKFNQYIDRSDNRFLGLQDFTSLVSRTFSFASLEHYKPVLEAIYKKISINGKLSYAQFYSGWIKHYVCEIDLEYEVEEYYVIEDDADENKCPIPPQPMPIPPPIPC